MIDMPAVFTMEHLVLLSKMQRDWENQAPKEQHS
jgi:hypothetical protein